MKRMRPTLSGLMVVALALALGGIGCDSDSKKENGSDTTASEDGTGGLDVAEPQADTTESPGEDVSGPEDVPPADVPAAEDVPPVEDIPVAADLPPVEDVPAKEEVTVEEPVTVDSGHDGWKKARCWDCHQADSHNTDLAPYQCVACHGKNGAPGGHKDGGSCGGCHGAKHGSDGFPDPVSCMTCHPK